MRLKKSLLLVSVLFFLAFFSASPVCTATEQVVMPQTQYQQLIQNSTTLRTELTTLQLQIEQLKTPSSQLVNQLAELDNKLAKSEEQLRVAQQNLTLSQNELESVKTSMKAISQSLEVLEQQYKSELEHNKNVQRRLRRQRTIYVATTIILAGVCACK